MNIGEAPGMQYKTVETVPSEISAWLQEPSSDCLGISYSFIPRR